MISFLMIIILDILIDFFIFFLKFLQDNPRKPSPYLSVRSASLLNLSSCFLHSVFFFFSFLLPILIIRHFVKVSSTLFDSLRRFGISLEKAWPSDVLEFITLLWVFLEHGNNSALSATVIFSLVLVFYFGVILCYIF